MYRFFLKLFKRRRFERDLEAEMAFHREMAAVAGNTIPLGNEAVLAEQARDLWRFAWVENLWRDVVYGARGLVRRPALFASAGLSLALGIGANTTVFSLGTELLLSQPSVADPSSLVYVRDGGNSHTSMETLEAVRRAGLFADVAGQREEDVMNWNDGQETRRIFAMVTTKNFFATVGTPVAIGRGIEATDPDEVVVLAHHFWTRRLGGEAKVVGQRITLDGRPFTVVGVLPASNRTLLGYGYAPDIYVPSQSPRDVLAMYGRLKPGMSVEATRAAIRAHGLDNDRPPVPGVFELRNLRLSAVAGLDRLRDESMAMTVATFFVVLLAIMALVLILACVNVAGLLLARGAARRRELAVRTALGAGRARLLQQLLVESLLLSLAGTAAGVLLAQWIAAQVSTLSLPLPIPVQLRADPDWRVVAYAAALAVLATVVSGMLPALQSVRESLAPDLHRERRLYLRRTLLVVQVAVSFVVLVGALLFVRNLLATQSVNPGFDTTRTIRVTASLPPTTYATADDLRRYLSTGLASLSVLPGIEAVAGVGALPFNDRSTRGHSVRWADTAETEHVQYTWNAVTDDYFRAMGIPISAGRSFRPADYGAGARAVVVNRLFVDRYLGGRSAVGATYVVDDQPPRTYQIVGVVDSVKTFTLGEDETPQLYDYLPTIVRGRRELVFVARAAGNPTSHLKPALTALRAIDPGVGLEVATVRDSMTIAFLPSQVGAIFMSAAGGLGLLLVAVGLFGTMAYAVTQRTREIGVRLALGATRGAVARMVLGDCGRLVVLGLAIGAAVAWFITQPLSAFLVPGLSPRDPVSFLTVLGVMLGTSAVATWLPAHRAAAIDPARSLRAE